MAARSVRLNGLEDRLDIVQGDIKEASRLFGKASFDVVTSNPPYMTDTHGLKNPDLPKAIARHEVLCTLEDVVREASLMLRTGGRFYMVHRPRRLAEIISVLRQYKLEPKRMKMVHPFIDKEANMVLIEAVRGGGVMMNVEAPVIVFREPGVYSEEIVTTYGY
jgi:tRNA1Val (adenine37-N6)-methyltransferase